MEDWVFWLRCAASRQAFYFHNIPGTQTLVRVHPHSTCQDRPRLVANVKRLRVHIKPLLATLGDANLMALNQGLLNEI